MDNTYPYGTGVPASSLIYGAVIDDTPEAGIFSGPIYYGQSVHVTDLFIMFGVFSPPANGVGMVDVPLFGLNWSWITESAKDTATGVWHTPAGDPEIGDSSNYPWEEFYRNDVLVL